MTSCKDFVDCCLRFLEALSGGLCIPPHRRGVALIHAIAILAHATQTTLSLCVSLLRRILEPLERLLVVHVHATAIPV
jgi:hypothetical protein